MMSNLFCWIFVFYFITIFNNYGVFCQECKVHIKNDLPLKSPVFLKNGKLHVPIGPYLIWDKGEETNIICSGSKNGLVTDGSNNIKIKCDGKKLTINGKKVDFNKLECTSQNIGDVINTEEKCLNDGTIYEIGFTISKNNFVKYIEVCYNVQTASVKYTKHVIHGEGINDSISESTRPAFSVREMPKRVKPNTSYQKKAQKERLTELLGPKAAANYIDDTSFLARGHLSPDKDGIFRSWQYATYFYLNVAPQWQSINAVNWLRVENLARKKAAAIQDDLEIVNGNSDILTLRNDNGKQIPITLEKNNGIIVPKYFWKILKYKNSAIAFVSLNNPFENSKPVCKSVCEKYKWPTTGFDILEKGIIYCCTVRDLFKKFENDVPEDFVTDNVLEY